MDAFCGALKDVDGLCDSLESTPLSMDGSSADCPSGFCLSVNPLGFNSGSTCLSLIDLRMQMDEVELPSSVL